VIAVRLYRDGLTQLLSKYGGFAIEAASDGETAIESAHSGQPDIVLLDTRFPDAVRTLAALRAASPNSHVIVLGVDETDDEIIAWAEAGVSGYVGIDASLDTLLETIRSVASGELLCSPRIAAALLRQVARRAVTTTNGAVHMTNRELDIMELIDSGASNKQIAANIEVSTVKNHVHNILEKLGATGRLQAAALLRPVISRRARRPASGL
jgi:DNA-binding NarL/FixJ family response regulator